MSKTIGIAYWTGTGNTEALAELLSELLSAEGASCELVNISASSFDVNAYDGIFLGCPAMGSEELEPSEFEPFYNEIEGKLGEKPVVLFGSYSWADGEWMRLWKENASNAGVKVFDTLIQFEAPDDDCRSRAEALAKAYVKAL